MSIQKLVHFKISLLPNKHQLYNFRWSKLFTNTGVETNKLIINQYFFNEGETIKRTPIRYYKHI